MSIKHIIHQFNQDLLVASGLLTLVLYFVETAKEGFVSFFFNPVWVLLVFLASGAIWFFSPENLEN